jgi:hypothetical protein
MIPDGSYTAVVDRIEDGYAAILLEVDGKDAHELVVDVSELPADGRHADAVLAVEITDEKLVEATYKPDETQKRRDAARERFGRLSERPPKDDE